MIIGAILETSNSGSGAQSANINGAAMMHFYSMREAENWAISQSGLVGYGTSGNAILTLCTVINTDTGVKRWWYNGIEYTG